MSSLYIVKQILPSVSSVAICDDALPNSRSESAYISLVRFTLEYAASVWDPHLAKDINKLENIQRRSARFVKGDYRTTSSVTQMLQELGWQDLQSRRRDLRLALLYKVVMGHVGIQPENVEPLMRELGRNIDLNFVLLVLQHKHSATLLRFEP